MATKSRNNGLIWSVASLFIALISFSYCFPTIWGFVTDGWERSSQIVAYYARIIIGGTL